MDSITHIALGAVVGEAVAGKYLGKRAMLIGALAQSIPDIDSLAAFFLSPADNLLAHRGITHSMLFAVFATTAFGVLGERLHRTQKMPYRFWFVLFGSEILIHLLLDSCNAYGIGLLEPFSNLRFSFHTLYVADLFFSIWPFVATVMLIVLSSKSHARRFWIHFGWIVCTGYFLYSIANKLMVTRDSEEALAIQQIKYDRLLTTPTPLNSWLWFIVAETDSGFQVGYRSTFDRRDEPMQFTYFPKQDDLLESIASMDEVNKLIEFSQGYYTIEVENGRLVFNDLRFGQSAGWADPHAPFAFHYYLNDPAANLLVMQRGRFANWNRETIASFLKRIKGT